MASIRLANAPCSWGVLEFGLEGETYGYARVLDEMAQSGYLGTELGDWGFMPTDPAALQDELQRRSLSLLGAFVPIALADPRAHAEGIATAVHVATLLAAVGASPFIVLADNNGTVAARTQNAGRILPEHGLDESRWKVFARGAEAVADTVFHETGVRTVFHHHGAGFVETPAEVARFLDLVDPQKIGLCFDTGHYAFGGGDPLEALKTHWNRISHVHFKDCHPGVARDSRDQGWDYFESVRHGIFCELGKGAVNFPAILHELQRHAYEGWIVVEQDVLPGMGSPLASAQRNREYLRSIGLD